MTDYNYQGHIIGPPGCGKTTLAAAIVEEHLDADMRDWAFVHDPKGQYRGSCAMYRSAQHWRDAAYAASQQQGTITRGAAIGGTNVVEVFELARELGERHRGRLRILVVVDEGSLLATSGGSTQWHMSSEDNVLLSMRRHFGVGLLFLQQRVNQLAAAFYDMATDVYLFKMVNPAGLKTLEQVVGVQTGLLVRSVPQLPEHEHIHIRVGKGLV